MARQNTSIWPKHFSTGKFFYRLLAFLLAMIAAVLAFENRSAWPWFLIAGLVSCVLARDIDENVGRLLQSLPLLFSRVFAAMSVTHCQADRNHVKATASVNDEDTATAPT